MACTTCCKGGTQKNRRASGATSIFCVRRKVTTDPPGMLVNYAIARKPCRADPEIEQIWQSSAKAVCMR